MSSSKKPPKVRVVMVKSAEETPRQAATVLRNGQPVKTDIANDSEETTSQTARIVGETESQSFKSDVTNARAGEETFHTATMLRKAQPVKIEEVSSDEETTPIYTVQNKARTQSFGYDGIYATAGKTTPRTATEQSEKVTRSEINDLEREQPREIGIVKVKESQALENVARPEKIKVGQAKILPVRRIVVKPIAVETTLPATYVLRKAQPVKSEEVTSAEETLPTISTVKNKVRAQSFGYGKICETADKETPLSTIEHSQTRTRSEKTYPESEQPGKIDSVEVTESESLENLILPEETKFGKARMLPSERYVGNATAGERKPQTEKVHDKGRKFQTQQPGELDIVRVSENQPWEIITLSEKITRVKDRNQSVRGDVASTSAGEETPQTARKRNKPRAYLMKQRLHKPMQGKNDYTGVTESQSLEILSLIEEIKTYFGEKTGPENKVILKEDDCNDDSHQMPMVSHMPETGNSNGRGIETTGIRMLQEISKERKSDINVIKKTKKSVMNKWFNQPKITKVKPFKPETTPKEKKKGNGHSKLNQLRMLVGRLITRFQNAITCGQI